MLFSSAGDLGDRDPQHGAISSEVFPVVPGLGPVLHGALKKE